MVRHHGRGGGKNMAAIFQMSIDLLGSRPPVVMNGIYSFTGNQMSAQAQIENFQMMEQQQMARNGGVHISQANMTIVGNKMKGSNNCCYIITLVLGSLLIIPLFLLCCMWWKKIVYPQYVLSDQIYRNLNYIINRSTGITNLTLTVVDNAFNAQKARILFDLLQNSNVKGFTFLNRALACNYMEDQADDFAKNMQPIRTLGIQTSIIWGDMIV